MLGRQTVSDMERELGKIVDDCRPQQTYNPRLSPSTNMMAKRLVNAERIYFEPGKSEYLWARWRDPVTGIINDGVISHLHA